MQGGIRLNLGDSSIDCLIPSTNAPELRVSIWGDSVRALLAGSTAGEWLSAHSRLDNPVPMNRFRPNLVVSGCDCFAEDGWRRIRIGEVEFDVAKPCSRCAIPSIDQATAQRDGQINRVLASYRRVNGQVMFGQNLLYQSVGSLSVGDPVEVLD